MMNNQNFSLYLLTLTIFCVLAAGCTDTMGQNPETSPITTTQPMDVTLNQNDVALIEYYQNDLDGIAIRIEELESEGYDTASLWDLYTEAEVCLYSARAALAKGDTLNYDLAMSDVFEYTESLEPILGDNP
jgi:hypothetical protein